MNLKKTVSIIIIDYSFEITKEMEEMSTKWKIIEDKYRKKVLTNKFEMYIIEIPKAKKVLKKDPNNKIAQWMMFFDNPNKT